jgi:putative ABC transport system permease protein
MFSNYFKVAWRNIWRNKTYSVIKILGLGIGLTVCMLIFLYTKDEVSYDQFHENKARLYRVIQTWQFGNKPPMTWGITNPIIGESFAKEIPEVQQYIRITGASITIKNNNEVFTETPMFVDDNFLSVFTFPLLRGNKETALQDLHSVVLSKNMAKKYFGTEDGKTMQVKIDNQFESFIVTALTNNPPLNTVFQADILMPYKFYDRYNDNRSWVGGSLNTFVLLSPTASVPVVAGKMQALFNKNSKERLAELSREQGARVTIKQGLQPLTGIYLSREAPTGNGMTIGSKPAYSYILACIAVFILVIACINFINLAVAQSLKRSKEIGVRKVMGSNRKQLIIQFLAESFVITAIAFIIALLLTVTALPFFNELANKKLSLSYLSDGYLYTGYFLLLLVTAFIAGFYPSLVLSAFQPVKVLYNRQKSAGKNYLTKGLIVLQFTLAVFLIIATIAVNSQLKFLLNADMGYDSKNLVRITLPINRSSDQLPGLFKKELANQPDIITVAAKNGGRSISQVNTNGKNIIIENNRIDDRFLPAFKIPLLAGRNFSPDYPSDTLQSVIVNESFIKEAGWTAQNSVGKTVNYVKNGKKATIIGVIKDYHFVSLKEKITPGLFSMDPNFNWGEVWIKIDPSNVPQTLALLEKIFKKLVPYFPYSYSFMDDINAKNYETETKWKQIISIASGLFIFISCIGLFGLVILSIEQRTKEIGIRKVLGAAVSGIVVLISKEFIILISIAFILAVPLGYYAVYKWLEDFAYRINITWWIFAIAGSLVMAIALFTLSFQAIRAALANPVKSLRSE